MIILNFNFYFYYQNCGYLVEADIQDLDSKLLEKSHNSLECLFGMSTSTLLICNNFLTKSTAWAVEVLIMGPGAAPCRSHPLPLLSLLPLPQVSASNVSPGLSSADPWVLWYPWLATAIVMDLSVYTGMLPPSTSPLLTHPLLSTLYLENMSSKVKLLIISINDSGTLNQA